MMPKEAEFMLLLEAELDKFNSFFVEKEEGYFIRQKLSTLKWKLEVKSREVEELRSKLEASRKRMQLSQAEFCELANTKHAAAVAFEADKAKLERELAVLKTMVAKIQAERDEAVGILHEMRKLLGLADGPRA